MNNNTLYLVVPCYNEQEVLRETCTRLKVKMHSLIEAGLISNDSRVMLVNDGSKDKTWQLIEEINSEDNLFGGVKLSRNCGHQNAVVAGLTYAVNYADMIISLDADLQDDINAIDGMVKAYHDGYEVVYGVRSKRDTDTAFKRTTAEGFYKFMTAMGVEIVDNHADYRLLSNRATKALLEFKEVNLFLRGIVPLVGYKSTSVTYERHERFAGESKYPLKKMLAFALDGITSFSIKPIRLIFTLGVIFAILGGLAFVLSLAFALISYQSTLSVFLVITGFITMMTGVNLIALGIVGEYVGKIYKETKARPRFFIETTI